MSAGQNRSSGSPTPPQGGATGALDGHEIAERVRAMRLRFDEFRGRL